jgi:hypothetical protein
MATRCTAGSSGTRSTWRRAPLNQTSTDTSRRSTAPPARVIASRTGIGARPRSSITISTSPPVRRAETSAWSSVQVSKNQVRQNHE